MPKKPKAALKTAADILPPALPGEEITSVEIPVDPAQPDVNYFELRCSAIGLTNERNMLHTKEYKVMPDSKIIEYPVLKEDPKTGDLLIPCYGLDGHPQNFYKDNPGKTQNGKTRPFEVRRYKPGNERKNKEDKAIKYDTPKGSKTIPWISPNIIEAHQADTSIDTIVIIEGYIKAISGWLNGLYIFGLSGIQNAKDKDTGTLHPDILQVIKDCKVNNIILLYDGDCANISLNALTDGKDLYQRPAGFFYSARNINELLKDYRQQRHFDVYFAHINTNDLDGDPKGLDDLFEAYPEKSQDIVTELLSFSRQKSFFFKRFIITTGLTKVLNHLHISNVDTFYTAHNQIIKEKLFVYNGTKFQFDAEKNQIKVIVPGAAKNYFRVGDFYYEKVMVPNKNGTLEYRYDKRQKSTIMDDHSKSLLNHVPKYKAFCTKPDHVNFQEVIDGCFNRYRPFEHTPSDSKECPEILNFLQHIFGIEDVTYINKLGEPALINEFDLGLDYIQLLYQRPAQALPILCLVSRENNTGKSTFGKLLKAIFTGNMAIVGNADLENDFNAGWADKLIICNEETLVNKKQVVEKIKGLSTGDKIYMNQKGIDQVEIDFFGKFLLFSNNEDTFTIANEHDERFWVRRVPPFGVERSGLLDLMIDEIPNFLYFLNNRFMATKNEGRMWFYSKAIKTAALLKLIEGNKAGPQRELHAIIKDVFTDTGFWQLQFTSKYISEKLMRNRYDRNYIQKLMRDNFGLRAAISAYRFKVPELRSISDAAGINDVKIYVNVDLGKPYTFTADQFLTAEEMEAFILSEEALFYGQTAFAPAWVIERSKEKLNAIVPVIPEQAELEMNDDLPF